MIETTTDLWKNVTVIPVRTLLPTKNDTGKNRNEAFINCVIYLVSPRERQAINDVNKETHDYKQRATRVKVTQSKALLSDTKSIKQKAER